MGKGVLKIGEEVVVLMFGKTCRPLIVESADNDLSAFSEILIFLLSSFTMHNLIMKVPRAVDFTPEKTV